MGKCQGTEDNKDGRFVVGVNLGTQYKQACDAVDWGTHVKKQAGDFGNVSGE